MAPRKAEVEVGMIWYDLLARLQVLTGFAGYDSWSWSGAGNPTDLMRGLSTAREFFSQAGRSVHPIWFSIEDQGLYQRAHAQALMVVGSNAAADVLHDLLIPNQCGRAQCRFWETGRNLYSSKALSHKESLCEAAGGVRKLVKNKAIDFHRMSETRRRKAQAQITRVNRLGGGLVRAQRTATNQEEFVLNQLLGNDIFRQELRALWLTDEVQGATRRVLEELLTVHFRRVTLRDPLWFASPEGGLPAPDRLRKPFMAALGELSGWEAHVSVPLQDLQSKVAEWVINPTLKYGWREDALHGVVSQVSLDEELRHMVCHGAGALSLTRQGQDYVRDRFSSAPMVARENPKWRLKPTLALPTASRLRAPTMAALGELTNWSPGIPVKMEKVQDLVSQMVLDPRVNYPWSITGEDGNHYSCLYRKIGLAYRSLRYSAKKGDKKVPLASSPRNGWWALTDEGAEVVRVRFSRTPEDKVTKSNVAKRARCSQQMAGRVISDALAQARGLVGRLFAGNEPTPLGDQFRRWSDLVELSGLGYGNSSFYIS